MLFEKFEKGGPSVDCMERFVHIVIPAGYSGIPVTHGFEKITHNAGIDAGHIACRYKNGLTPCLKCAGMQAANGPVPFLWSAIQRIPSRWQNRLPCTGSFATRMISSTTGRMVPTSRSIKVLPSYTKKYFSRPLARLASPPTRITAERLTVFIFAHHFQGSGTRHNCYRVRGTGISPLQGFVSTRHGSDNSGHEPADCIPLPDHNCT